MDVLLKEAGYCTTKITGKAGTGRPRRFSRLYPTTRACGKRGRGRERERARNPHGRKPLLRQSSCFASGSNAPCNHCADCYTKSRMDCAAPKSVSASRLSIGAVVAWVAATMTLSAQVSKPARDVCRRTGAAYGSERSRGGERHQGEAHVPLAQEDPEGFANPTLRGNQRGPGGDAHRHQ